MAVVHPSSLLQTLAAGGREIRWRPAGRGCSRSSLGVQALHARGRVAILLLGLARESKHKKNRSFLLSSNTAFPSC